MKYFLISDEKETYCVVTKNEERAIELATRSDIKIKEIYELKKNTFNKEEFLFTNNLLRVLYDCHEDQLLRIVPS